MSVQRKIEVRPIRSTDPLWWALAALLGLVSLWLPQWLQIGADPTTRLLVVESALFFSGGLVGGLRPVRVWRWGAACLVAFVVKDLAQFANSAQLANGVKVGILPFLSANASVYALHTIPVLAGAYLGAYMNRGGQK